MGKIALSNIELSSGGRTRVGSDGRIQCLRWSGELLEREVEVSEGTTMMDTGEVADKLRILKLRSIHQTFTRQYQGKY